MENEDSLFIDGWRVDVESNRISRDGVEQKLEPRSMELLVYLSRRPGQVVSRAEIEGQVWRGRVVSYEALSGTIAKIRKAFADTGKQHRIIETIPKSGYRIIAPILHSNSQPALSSEVVTSTFLSSKNTKAIIGATTLAAMVMVISWWQPWIEREQPLSLDRMAFQLPDNPSIAILPFTNMSDDAGQDYFADGMTEDLITDLAKVSGFFCNRA
jgi:DNA-binding winged helix-turn-helix (wHTH) protein